MSTRQEKILKLKLLQEKRKRNFYLFFSKTIPRYIDSPFYHHLCTQLQKFSVTLKEKDFPHLMLNLCPRVGKSAAVLRFCLWMMLTNKDFKVIYGTYADRISKIMSRDMKLILESDYVKEVFPDITIKNSFSALDNWALTNESSIYFTSIGGSVSGIGFNLGILDDIFASMETAKSSAYKEQMFSWTSSAFMTRGLPDMHGIIFLFTRWTIDDLYGYVEREEKNNDLFPKFEKIQYPIINEKGCPFGKEGDSLIPERFSLSLLSQLKAKVGTKVWDALYLCNPQSDSERIFNLEWIEQVDKLPICNWNRQDVVVAVDTAFTGRATSDYSVAVCLAKGLDGRLYMLDYLRLQADFVTFLKEFTSWYNKLPIVNQLIIEAKANGESLKSVLKDKFHNIKMISPDRDKVLRASAVAPMVESGSLIFLRANKPDYNDLLEELEKFPTAPHDDFVDALVYTLTYFLEKSQKSFKDINWSSLGL